MIFFPISFHFVSFINRRTNRTKKKVEKEKETIRRASKKKGNDEKVEEEDEIFEKCLQRWNKFI